MEESKVYDMAKYLYEDVLQKGETFSIDMGREIEKELEKLKKQREEWLKKHINEKKDDTDKIDS